MTTATPRLKVLGTSNDRDTCDCCGRTNLKMTVVLARLDRDGATEEVLYFGRDCAARATRLRRTGAAMEALAAEAQRQADEEVRMTPVRCGEGEALWVVESISGNGAKVETIRFAVGGGYHAVERWARETYPAKELNVRRAR